MASKVRGVASGALAAFCLAGGAANQIEVGAAVAGLTAKPGMNLTFLHKGGCGCDVATNAICGNGRCHRIDHHLGAVVMVMAVLVVTMTFDTATTVSRHA